MTRTILPPGGVYALTDIRAHDVTYPGYHQVRVPAYVARPAQGGPPRRARPPSWTDRRARDPRPRRAHEGCRPPLRHPWLRRPPAGPLLSGGVPRRGRRGGPAESRRVVARAPQRADDR